MPKRSSRYNKRGPLKGGTIANYRLDVQAMIFDPKQARAEYARLRREANRRLEVLRRSEFAKLPSVANRPGSYEALPAPGHFPKGVKDEEAYVRNKLYDVARFLNLRTSSFQGAKRSRREFVSSLKEHGYYFVNEENADAFGRFMGAVQKHKEAKGYDSEQVLALFYVAREKRIDPETLAEDFEFWLEHTPELVAAPRATHYTSSEKFAEKIGLQIE